MTIDIQRTVIKNQLRRMITIIVYALIIMLIMLVGNFKDEILGIGKVQWALIVTAIFTVSWIVEGMLELNYIYFCDNDEFIVFRYFSMSFLNHKKNSIEIPKDRFSGYIIQKSLGGFKTKIILKQHIKDIDAKYPAVSLTALSKNELSKLLKALDKYQ